MQRLINAMGYSINGFQAAWQHETAFRQVVLLACAGITIVMLVSLPTWGRIAVILSHALCIVVELLNSAIEAAVDHTSLDLHFLAKRAKDLGSAAQFASLINLAVIWGLVLTAP